MPERKCKVFGGVRNLPEYCVFLFFFNKKLFKALVVTERLGTVLFWTSETSYLQIHLIRLKNILIIASIVKNMELDWGRVKQLTCADRSSPSTGTQLNWKCVNPQENVWEAWMRDVGSLMQDKILFSGGKV